MEINLSLDRYAEKWADRSVGTAESDMHRNEVSQYNFKATTFNLATAATIASIAWVILSPLNPVALLALALSGLTRNAVLENIHQKHDLSRDLRSEFVRPTPLIKAAVVEFVALLSLRTLPPKSSNSCVGVAAEGEECESMEREGRDVVGSPKAPTYNSFGGIAYSSSYATPVHPPRPSAGPRDTPLSTPPSSYAAASRKYGLHSSLAGVGASGE